MSAIQKKTTEKITHTKTIGYKCNVCGKEINGDSDSGYHNKSGWHGFSSSHSEWGNDSCGSLKYYDVCSVKCYAKQIESILEKHSKYSSLEIDEMNIKFARKLITSLKEGL